MDTRKVLAATIIVALLAILAYFVYGILSRLGYHFNGVDIDVDVGLLVRNILILTAALAAIFITYLLFKRSRAGATLFLSASGLILFIVLELEVLSIFGGMVVGAQVFAILLITYAIALWKWL